MSDDQTLMPTARFPVGSRPLLYGVCRVAAQDYANSFQGMTAEPVPLDVLLAARERLVRELQQGLDESERRFLPSLVTGTPEWPLLGIAYLEHLPGTCWKLRNLAQLQKANARKFAEQAEMLSSRLISTTTAA